MNTVNNDPADISIEELKGLLRKEAGKERATSRYCKVRGRFTTIHTAEQITTLIDDDTLKTASGPVEDLEQLFVDLDQMIIIQEIS